MTPIQKDGPDVNDYYCGLDPFSSHVIRNYDLFIGKNYSLKILNILESIQKGAEVPILRWFF